MPTSAANILATNLELSPVRVTFDGVDLGATLGNVSLSVGYPKAELKADQLGDTVIDRRVTGMNITVTTEIAEINLKDNWKVVFPHARLVGSGANKQMYFESKVGDSDVANAKVLVLHPLSKANADLSGDHKFFLACASAESEITYGPNDQARLKLVWNILPDLSVSPARFYVHGDPGIGLVAAVAGTPSYSGTGNGTISSVTAYSGITKTEVITIKCVTPVANGGVFSVTGSLSGSLGLATVGSSFIPTGADPAVISFTINDGATDFVLNDEFTIATTAANYA